MLATIEKRWGLDPLTKRDAAAADVGSVLTLAAPRTDDPIAGVVPPAYVAPVGPNAAALGVHPPTFVETHAQLAAGLPVPSAPLPDPDAAVAALPQKSAAYGKFIDDRLTRWNQAKPA